METAYADARDLDSGRAHEYVGHGVRKGNRQPLEATASVTTAAPVYAAQFGAKGTGAGQFVEPHSVAMAKDGNLFVLDSGNDRVEEFSQAGKYESAFGALGSGNGQLKVPYSLAVESKGNVWITDQANSRVEELNEKGVFVKTFGYGVSDGKAEAEVCAASCKAVSPA